MKHFHEGPLVLRAFDPAKDSLELIMPLGSTIEDAVKLGLPNMPREQWDSVRVIWGEFEVPPHMWARVRPKLWDRIFIRVIPGLNSTQLGILQLAVTVAAVALGQWYLGPALAGEGIAGFSGLGLAAGSPGFNAVVAGTSLAPAIGTAPLFNALSFNDEKSL